MTLAITPQIMAAGYDFLRECPPFKSWRLPESDVVELCITRHRDREGDHTTYQRTTDHIIRVSGVLVNTMDGLLRVVAHELIHARQEITKTTTRAEHNAEFHRLASRVCKIHGWDFKAFVY